MKRYLLPKSGNFYKANLHMHTTISDGRMTPEETKTEFMKRGYSIVAFTDHEVIVPHPELNDENFLAITSFEMATNLPSQNDEFEFVKACHLNFYAKEADNVEFPGYNAGNIWQEHTRRYVSEALKKYSYRRVYSVDCFNDIIRMANESGFFVCYNHPVWSLQDYSDYIDYKGLWGVECLNYGCAIAGYPDTMQPIDDLLRKNQRVFPVASDDAHSLRDCFGGFCMIKAEKLEYSSIIGALLRGDFYASGGPEIRELYLEDGILTVRASDAARIMLTTDCRYAGVRQCDGAITEATFDLNGFFQLNKKRVNRINPGYFRVTVTDAQGRSAQSRAYFADEFEI